MSLTAVDAPEGVRGGLVPEPDISVEEVEGVKLELDELGFEAASEIFKNYKAAPTSPRPIKLIETGS